MACHRFFLLLLCLSFLFSCHRNVVTDPETITVGIEAYPENLDPRFAVDALSSKICRLLYTGLFQLSENLEVVPDLADEIRIVSDTSYEIVIRGDVFFHNGKKLTARDVAATYNSVLDPQVQSPHRGVFEKIKTIEVIDDKTLRLTLKEPFAPIFTSLTLGILPEEVAEQSSAVADFRPTGTGPYRFLEARVSEKVVLERFDGYFAEKPKNRRLVFRTIYDDTLRTLETIQGRIDLAQNAIPYILLPAVEKRKGLTLTTSAGINFSYIGFNLKDPILAHRDVRRAITLAINREEIIRYKLKNLARPAASLLFPGHWAIDSSIKPLEYNPSEAARLLDSAGFTDPDGTGPKPRFYLIYKTSTKKDRVEMALLIADQLKKVGIEVEVKPYEWGTFFRDIRMGNFQLYSLTWVGVSEPDIYYLAFHSSMIPPEGANRGYYSNPQIDTLVTEGRQTPDVARRKEIYQKVQEIIFNDFPYAPLWYEDNWVVVQEKLKGYRPRPDAGFQGLIRAYKE